MVAAFYFAGAVAIIATVLTITRQNVVHALIYLIVSLLAVAVAFYTMGAPFIAALEVIIYAGAIMVLFVFVIMMLNLGARAQALERQWHTRGMWRGPAVLSALLLVEVAWLLFHTPALPLSGAVEPVQVGTALFGPYAIAVELASMLLLAGMAGAYHLGYPDPKETEAPDAADSDERRIAPGVDLVHAGARRPDRAP